MFNYLYGSTSSITNTVSALSGLALTLIERQLPPRFFKTKVAVSNSSIQRFLANSQKTNLLNETPSVFVKSATSLMGGAYSDRSSSQYQSVINSPFYFQTNKIMFLPSILKDDDSGLLLSFEDKRMRLEFSSKIFTESEEQAWNIVNLLRNNLNFERPFFKNRVLMEFELPNEMISLLSSHYKIPVGNINDLSTLIEKVNQVSNKEFRFGLGDNTGRVNISYLDNRNLLINLQNPSIQNKIKDDVVVHSVIELNGWIELNTPSSFMLATLEEIDDSIPRPPILQDSEFVGLSFVKSYLPKVSETGVKKVEFKFKADSNSNVSSVDYNSILPSDLKTFIAENKLSEKYYFSIIEDGSNFLSSFDFTVDKNNMKLNFINVNKSSVYSVGLYLTKEANSEFNIRRNDL